MKVVAFPLCFALLLTLNFQKGNCSSSCDLSTLSSNASSVMCEQQSDLEMIEFMEDVLRSIAALDRMMNDTKTRLNLLKGKDVAGELPLLNGTCASLPTRVGPTTLQSGEKVYCLRGWTVFQRRFNGQVVFHNRTWNEYKNGFGDVAGEFWLGLNKVHVVTSSSQCRLRVEISDWDGASAWAEYSVFRIANEADLFSITFSGYSGTAGNAMDNGHSLNNRPFTTVDRDNDKHQSRNCASVEGGAWWHKFCSYSKLNGRWGRNHNSQGISWYTWKKRYYGLKSSMMMVRCD